MNNSVDWDIVRAEYIAGGISYRQLAEKHGVSFSTLKEVARREKWTDLKEKANHKTNTILAESIGKRNAKKSAKIEDLADRLLDKIGKLIELLESGKDIKNIASALKDIKEVKGIKDKLDLKEQKARIKKLEKEAKEDSKTDNEVNVVMDSGLEEYSE